MGVGEEGGPLGLGNHERSAGQFVFFLLGSWTVKDEGINIQ